MSDRARVLYIGNLRAGGNGRDWMTALESHGFQVEGFDRYKYTVAGLRLEKSISARWQLGRAVSRFNSDLADRAAHWKFDVLFVEKGVWLFPEVLERMRELASFKIAIHYTPDAQFLENRSRHFFRGIPHYDLLVTTKEFELGHYKEAGARELLLILQGYGRRLRPQPAGDVPPELCSEICFVGHCQAHYAGRLERLSKVGGLAIWGPNWHRYALFHAWARPCVRGAGLWGADYARALAGTKIAIGLLSKRIPETTTTRSFEIPACGAFMLAERTDAHQELFEEGREAEFFSSDEELCDKAAFYLRNDRARSRIAAAGYSRCLESGYAAEQQFGRIVDWLSNRGAGSLRSAPP